MKKLLLIPLVVILIAGTCLGTGCPEKGPEVGSVLRVSMSSFGYETFDPIVGESFWGWQMYDPIVTWDEEGNFIGGLAESWTLSEDGKTWTFNVRQGVNFWNGDPVTSADLMFSVEHMQDPTSWNPWSPYLSYNFDTMYCPDAETFVYKTVEPEPTLIMCFAATRVLPKNYIEENGIEYFREQPMGSGPWKFVSLTSGEKIIMEANTEHWRTVPHFETFIQYVIPEEATQIAMLKRGEMDIITGISLDKVEELRDEGWRVEATSVPTSSIVIMPGTWMPEAGPTHDIRVRQALAYSINIQEICDTFFHGFARPGGRFFMDERTWGWGEDWEPEPYDPALAAQLLADAGYPEAFDDPVIDIYLDVASGYTIDLFQIFQGYWAEVGIQTEIHMVDAWEWAGMFFVPHFDEPEAPNIGAIFPWVFGNFYASNVYHSRNMYCAGGVHTTSNDPQALVLYTKAIRELDPDLAEQYWTDFQAYCHDVMFINFGVALIYDQLIMGPEVGDFGWGYWLSAFEGFADLEHK